MQKGTQPLARWEWEAFCREKGHKLSISAQVKLFSS